MAGDPAKARRMVSVNPITEEPLPEPRPYYLVTFQLHDGKEYTYLIPSRDNGDPPSVKEIGAAIDEYAKHPLPYARDWNDYIAEDWEEG